MQLTTPNIYVFMGMIATGKSTLAHLWAQKHNCSYYNSDLLRKNLADNHVQHSRNSSWENGIYTPEFTEKTYVLLIEKAIDEIKNNRCVVLDASYSKERYRKNVVDLPEKYPASVHFILCHCPEAIMKERMEIRAKDPTTVSDGRWEIYLQQKQSFEPPKEISNRLISIDTSENPQTLLKELEKRIVAS